MENVFTVTGLGTQDDGPIINAAIANHRHIVVPPGEWEIKTPIDFSAIDTSQPYRFSFDASKVYFIATAAMPCLVRIYRIFNGQILGADIKLGALEGNGLANCGLYLSAISDSEITCNLVTGAKNGIIAQQVGEYGVFNNFIQIGSILRNSANGFVILSPLTGHVGFQGNQVKLGQVFQNGASGLLVGGAPNDRSVFNSFHIGASEHNGLFGIYDNTGSNLFFVNNTNNNGIRGFQGVATVPSKVTGFFEDGM